MAVATPTWEVLPPTPELPPARHQSFAKVNGISMWYGLFGRALGSTPSKPPVVLLHGGKISSRWYSHLITFLQPSYSVIAVDTRGHGKSSDDLSVPLSYGQFARDVVSLLDLLRISRASIVGWSDGANTALDLAMNHSPRVSRVVAFGANYDPNQANITGITNMPFLADLVQREESEYNALNPNPDWATFGSRMGQMQSTSPKWNQSDFDRIPDHVASKILCADGEHEEIVLRNVVYELHDMIQNSQLAIIPGVSHFAPLQDPAGFGATVKRFLEK